MVSCSLNACIGFEPERYPSVLLPAQLHDKPVSVRHGLGVPVIALQ